jgi:L-ribulose-5-phosphate 4-epimerase
MSENRQELKEKLAEMVRVLAAGEIFTLTSGHISHRVPETNEILIPRHIHHEGKTLSMITADDIVTIDLDGNLLEGTAAPPGERFVHTCIYKKRAEVRSVIHAHPHLSMAFGVAGVELIPVYLKAIVFAPRVEILDFAGQIDTEALGIKVADALKENFALLLRGHGVVIAGISPEEACVNAFTLETNAQIQLWATLLGTPKPVSTEEVLGLGKPGKKAHKITNTWPFYLEKYGKNPSRGPWG